MFTSLADVVGRKAPVQWFEGVAIVQSLARQLLDTAAGPVGVPDLERIVLTSEGEVVAGADGGDGNPVRDLGRLLTTLVPAEEMPPPLRTVAAKATATPTAFADLGELVQALTYFERPNLRDPIRAVYARWLLLPPEEEPQAPRPGNPPPASKPLVQGSPTRRPDWTRRMGVASALIIVLAAIGVPSWWTWIRGHPASNDPPGEAVQIVDAPTTEAPSARDGSPVEPTRAGAAASAAGNSAARGSRLPGIRSNPARRRALHGSAATIGSAPPSSASPQPGPVPTPAAAAAVGAPEAANAAGERDIVDNAVYSAEDAGVTPPVPVRALQRSLPAGAPDRNLPVVEVIVSANGDVESARLLVRSGEMYAVGMMSVVKAWRFRPATKDGRPVRYRCRIALTGR